ncbi:nickel ABC transporter permease [Geosporobacter ferrireducens]|uniref:Nickel import system permease protein NikB n=1 Tax=Geosporobacter ferrireducens TaxID=1424294 RepID=A0A1D8GL37_9FIRM|nr:nickel ABC transporter permease [Geosporobacter ferrireducens]AOT71624.1 nickel ABC transporter permease subunit NikB [Geosporobacter ferrireducens]MTI55389.1 ABC transporter permease subunit [Geosporobacter ferrireducens]
MRSFIVRRLISLIPVVLGISVVTFLLVHLMPVDPAQAYLSVVKIPPTDEAIAAARIELGLNKPLPIRYMEWMGNALRLDFGKSYVTKKPVLEELMYAFPATVQLASFAFAWLVVISIPLGLLSALHKNSILDHISRLISFAGASMPSFWLGFILIYIFSLKLGLFPVMGRGTARHVILPSFTLAVGLAASYIRLLRANILENMRHQSVLYARARGLKEKLILGRYVLKNSLLPILNAFGINFGYLLTGSFIVENVFAWPGIGRLITQSIFNRDYPMIQGYVIFTAVIFVFSNLIVDVLSAYLDPRIRKGEI